MTAPLDPRSREARRDVIALVTAYVAIADDEGAPPADDPVRLLLAEVCAQAEYGTPYLLGLIGALLTELAQSEGTTAQELWRKRALALTLVYPEGDNR
ncbi:hypothetical protein [Streptomyces justiciae]|uniref:hypothetical protein n=1 Tax=Streptomyces justiciae TaxID=2780140 RepID=UPI00188032FB|nr:hypothetical protein [Streptomyces justiciae]MBE8471065.1 hypothetical protein [Streptomyces justiciae]